MQTSIRVITPQHLEAAATTNHRSWHASNAERFPAGYIARHTLDHYRSQWREMFVEQVNGYSCLLGSFASDSSIVGVIRVGAYDGRRDVSGLRNCVAVSRVYVDPDYQNQGVGSEMLGAVERVGQTIVGKAGGVGVLWVAKMNEGQEKFYSRAGWAELDRSPENRGGVEVEVTRFVKLVKPPRNIGLEL